MKNKLIIYLTIIQASIFQARSYSQVYTLDFFISQGLAHSPVLKEISNQISSNQVDSLLIKAGQRPQANFSAGLYYAPIINGIGYAEPLTNISSVKSVVGVSQRVFNQKTLDVQYSKLGIENQSLRISSKINTNDLKKAITVQYLSACSVSNDISFNRELLAESKEEELILKKLVDNGLYKQVDYYLFLLELKTQELAINDLVIHYRNEVSALNTLCGLADTTYSQVVLPELKVNPYVNPSNSPFFTRFITDSLKIQNEKLILDRNYKPSVNWFSDAGLLNNIPRDIYKNFGFSIGAGLTVPIYDGHQRKLNYEKLKIAENTRAGYAGYFKQQFSQQLMQLYGELKKTQEIIPEVRQQLEYAQLVIEQDKSLLNTGNISITDYVTALKNYISIKHNFSQYQIRILQIIAEINYWNQ
jgi:outer membrane protein TolC